MGPLQLTDLPNELLARIAEFYFSSLGDTDGSRDFTLSLVSKHLRALCIPYLFQSVRLGRQLTAASQKTAASFSDWRDEIDDLRQDGRIAASIETLVVSSKGHSARAELQVLHERIGSLTRLKALGVRDSVIMLPSDLRRSSGHAPLCSPLWPVRELMLSDVFIPANTARVPQTANFPNLEKVALLNLSWSTMSRMVFRRLLRADLHQHVSYLCVGDSRPFPYMTHWLPIQLIGLADQANFPALSHLSFRGRIRGHASGGFQAALAKLPNLRMVDFLDQHAVRRSIRPPLVPDAPPGMPDDRLTEERRRVARIWFAACPKLERVCLNRARTGQIFRRAEERDGWPAGAAVVVDGYLGKDGVTKEGLPIDGGVYPEGTVWENGWPRVMALRLETL